MDVLIKYYTKNRYKLVKMVGARVGTEYNAEDIVQEAFKRAIEYYRSYEGGNNIELFGRWFGGILNRCEKDFKNEERMGGMCLEIKEELIFSEDEFGENNKLLEEIEEMIGELKSNAKNICYLYFIKQHTPREIVRILDIPSKTVRMCVHRFRGKLKERYG